MIKKKDLSEKDIETWEAYTKNPTDLYDKDKNNQKNQERKERFKFDLHGHTLDEANQIVKDIIFSCVKNKYKEILFITGKGLHSDNKNNPYVSKDLGILKYSVPDYIKNSNYLMSMIHDIKDAIIEDGGQGAFYIFLKNKFKK